MADGPVLEKLSLGSISSTVCLELAKVLKESAILKDVDRVRMVNL